jgi:hypothetical protein
VCQCWSLLVKKFEREWSVLVCNVGFEFVISELMVRLFLRFFFWYLIGPWFMLNNVISGGRSIPNVNRMSWKDVFILRVIVCKEFGELWLLLKSVACRVCRVAHQQLMDVLWRSTFCGSHPSRVVYVMSGISGSTCKTEQFYNWHHCWGLFIWAMQCQCFPLGCTIYVSPVWVQIKKKKSSTFYRVCGSNYNQAGHSYLYT